MNITRDTRLIDLTIGEFEDWLRGKMQQPSTERTEKHYAYGIRGIMGLFHCSEVTAHRYKRTFLAPAVSQQGKKIVVDADKAMQLFREYKNQ